MTMTDSPVLAKLRFSMMMARAPRAVAVAIRALIAARRCPSRVADGSPARSRAMVAGTPRTLPSAAMTSAPGGKVLPGQRRQVRAHRLQHGLVLRRQAQPGPHPRTARRGRHERDANRPQGTSYQPATPPPEAGCRPFRCSVTITHSVYCSYLLSLVKHAG